MPLPAAQDRYLRTCQYRLIPFYHPFIGFPKKQNLTKLIVSTLEKRKVGSKAGENHNIESAPEAGDERVLHTAVKLKDRRLHHKAETDQVYKLSPTRRHPFIYGSWFSFR